MKIGLAQNTIDFITKYIPKYILRLIIADTACQFTIHVGIVAFGSILVGLLHAQFERSWKAMMKK